MQMWHCTQTLTRPVNLVFRSRKNKTQVSELSVKKQMQVNLVFRSRNKDDSDKDDWVTRMIRLPEGGEI
jgi:hypothetical protein